MEVIMFKGFTRQFLLPAALLAGMLPSAYASGPGAEAAADAFGGRSFCDFHRDFVRETPRGPVSSMDLVANIEDDFARKYVHGLRTGQLPRPSVVPLALPLSRLGGDVVVYSPAAGTLAVQGQAVTAAPHEVRLERTGQKGVRLDLTGHGRVVIDESVSSAGLEELYVFTDGGDVSIEVRGMAPCGLIDGGREHARGSLKVDASAAVLPTQDSSLATAATCVQNIYGTAGNDSINGSACNDNIYGYAGNDTLFGNEGRDYIMGQGGSDTINGNAGNDCVANGFEDFSTDLLRGGQGDDLIFANAYPNESCYGDLHVQGDACSPLCNYFDASCEASIVAASCYAN
jgi:hypothetical protein